MFISVIILSYNSERTLERCLNSTISTLDSYDSQSEIFVVENGSKDGSKAMLERFVECRPDLIKPIVFSENTGTTASRNAALNRAAGEYLLVLDSDAYIDKEALSLMVSKLQSDKSIGMVCPRLSYADGRHQISTDEFPTLFRKAQRFLSLGKMQESIDVDSLKEEDVDYAISACWLLARESVAPVGGFDEKIFYSPEDVDYCIVLWEKGFRIRYLPEAHVIHDAQELSRGFKLSFFHFSHLSGLFYLFKKHKYFFSPRGLRKRLRGNI
jgi:GT2 family glycosyltransferase